MHSLMQHTFQVSSLYQVALSQERDIRNHVIHLKKNGESSLLPLFGKKFGNMPLFANYIGVCPCFETRLP